MQHHFLLVCLDSTPAGSIAPITNSVKTNKQEMMLLTSQVQCEPSTIGQGVMTRAAAAKLPIIYYEAAPDDPKKTLTKKAMSKVSPEESIDEPKESVDTAIMSSGSLSARENINPHPVECPLLTDLLGPGKA